MNILKHATFLFALCFAAESHAATYKGIAVDQKSGKPVEGLRILCRQFVVDHGLGNHLRAKVLGYDFADVDTSIMAAVVTGADGTFALTAEGGTPMRSVSVIKNGEYGVYNHPHEPSFFYAKTYPCLALCLAPQSETHNKQIGQGARQGARQGHLAIPWDGCDWDYEITTTSRGGNHDFATREPVAHTQTSRL